MVVVSHIMSFYCELVRKNRCRMLHRLVKNQLVFDALFFVEDELQIHFLVLDFLKTLTKKPF